MIKIYFAGQDNFGNRGCEALVRSNVSTIQKYIPDANFLVPTRNMQLDKAQWKEAKNLGVTFISAEPIPSTIRWWGRIRRVWNKVEHISPKYTVSKSTCDAILGCDALIMTGGDIISLDYGLESLYYWTRICEVAMDANIPTVLWAASVGPFLENSITETKMKSFLKRFSLITVRETVSLKYLKSIGIDNVELVIDPAFSLDNEELPISILDFFKSGLPILGFNVSPLIHKFRKVENNSLDNEIINFLIEVLNDLKFKVLLIPHVDPLDGSADNSDWVYMKKLLESVRAAGFGAEKIEILPRDSNTAQLKGIIGRCTYFMGARTHATIAALSQGVPTTSISYSIKAKGINQDLFNHSRYVLDTPDVTSSTLMLHLTQLIEDSSDIRKHLNEYLDLWKKKSEYSAFLLKSLLN